jgi:glycosyltransferase 2 family protein
MIRRPWLRAIIGIAISAAFVAGTLARVELSLVAEGWAGVSLWLVALVTLVSFGEVLIRALRWRILLGALAPASFRTAFGYLTLGHLANAILPARLGDLGRALLAGPRLRTSRASVLGTIAVERVADAALLSLAVSLAVVFGYRQLATMAISLGIAALVSLAVVVTALIMLRREAILRTRLGGLARRLAHRFVAGAAALRSPVRALQVVLLSGASFALAVTIFFVVAAAVGLQLPLWQAALVMATVTLSTAIPAGPASVGTYEFVGMSVMIAMGFPAEQALLCVVLVHAVVTLPPAISGLVAMWWLGIRPRLTGFGDVHRSTVSERTT